MAIYKLDKICKTIRGNSSFQKKDLKSEKQPGDYVALHYGKTYKVNEVLSDFSFYCNNEFYKENQLVEKNDTIFVSTSETLEDLGHSYIYKRDDTGLLGGEQILLKAKENIVKKEYLYYLTKGLKKQLQMQATGMKVYRFKKEDFKNINVEIPSLKDQQHIIDIIKPIELSINCLKLQKENIEKILEKLPINTTNKYIIFDSIKTGRRNANHENNDGKYNFYTCGEKIRKCEEFSFNGRYILLSGNANLYSWWYNGKFDLYQRVYALSPSSDFFTSYHSVKKEMQKLRNESSGSVIKYIKIGDIEHIKKLNNNFEKILETLYNALSKTDSLIELMENLRKNQLELLIK